jgi:NADH-ubiquinone oxidoreductase chain 1
VAETNRAPFDLAEAESELVSGFMTEHAAGIFVFFFLAEYASIILMCILISIVLLGGYDILSFVSILINFLYNIIAFILSIFISIIFLIIDYLNINLLYFNIILFNPNSLNEFIYEYLINDIM